MNETKGSLDPHPLLALAPHRGPDAARLPSPEGLRHATGKLSRRALDTAVAVAEALFSDGVNPPAPERMAFVRREFGDLMARAMPRGRLLFVAGLLVISVIAPVMVRRLPPFRRLPLTTRVAALEKMESSRLSPVLIAVRAMLCLVYFEHEDAAAEAGIGTEPLIR